MTSRIGLLMLAYDGVHNPLIWERWVRYLKNHGIETDIGIINNTRAKNQINVGFTRQHDLNVDVHTKWCRISLVEAIVQGYGKFLDKFEETEFGVWNGYSSRVCYRYI